MIFTAPQEILDFVPNQLSWHRDRLYFSQGALLNHGLRAVPTTGGSQTTLSELTPWRFWVEDDGVVFASPEGLQRIPLAGGAPEPLISVPIWPPGTSSLTQAMDDEAFFWVNGFGKSSTIQKLSRTGGLPVELTHTNDEDGIEKIVPLKNEIVALSYAGFHAWVVPRDGGEARPLPAKGEVIGASGEGALLWRAEGGGFDGSKGSDRYLVYQSRVDGAPPVPFWSAKPPSAFPHAAWADGAGGWFISAWEWGTDDALHETVWSVDRVGNGRRLACDPEVKSTASVAAVGSDGLYLLVEQSNLRTWQIAHVR